MSRLVIDPELERKAKDTEPQEAVNLTNNLWFFEQCEANRELLKSIEVAVPVRPEDGMNCQLSRMLAVWYGEGTPWSQVNDNCGGFIELTRANIAYNFVHRQYPGPRPDYLLMIDNDMEPPINLPYLLGRHAEPVVSGVAVHIHPEVGPRACFTVPSDDGGYRWPQMRIHKVPAKGLVKCGHVGTGAILIRRDVLEAFTFEKGDVPFYVPEEIRLAGASVGRLTLGEDLAFCEAIREKGFDCFVDVEAHCGHRKTVTMSWAKENVDPTIDARTWRLPGNEGSPVGR